MHVEYGNKAIIQARYPLSSIIDERVLSGNGLCMEGVLSKGVLSGNGLCVEGVMYGGGFVRGGFVRAPRETYARGAAN